MIDYNSLLEICTTENQRSKVQACIDYPSQQKAALALGIHISSLEKTLLKLRYRAEALGKSKHYLQDINIPQHLPVSGTSTLVKTEEGLQWIKTKASDQAKLKMMQDAVDALKEELPVYKPLPKHKNDMHNPDLVNLFTLTDTHIGDWASSALGGDDWDLQIADKTICGIMQKMVDESPKAETAILALLGDLIHYDSALYPHTPRSLNVLDTDGSMEMIVPVAIRILRRVIDILAQTHEKLVISIVRGNHDEASTIWIKEFLVQIYSNNPRIEILEGRLDYQVYQVGNLMLGWHHGDRRKPEQLPLLFATEYGKEWGASEYRYLHSGDKHHYSAKDISGVEVVQHEIMSGRNRYATVGGYASKRGATRYTYDINKGKIGSGTVPVI